MPQRQWVELKTSDKFLKFENGVLSINDIDLLGYPTTCRADENMV
jgi:hypothetical protein